MDILINKYVINLLLIVLERKRINLVEFENQKGIMPN